MLAQAVAAAKEAWGQRQLSELDAEERLAMACEKAPTSDHATSKLRAAFRVLLTPPPSTPPVPVRHPTSTIGRGTLTCSVNGERPSPVVKKVYILTAFRNSGAIMNTGLCRGWRRTTSQ